jgi:D-serine deaminase-like pyridoxal phosphate-dependent protein
MHTSSVLRNTPRRRLCDAPGRMDWADFVRALDGEPLPAGLVDLDALDRNIDRVRRSAERSGKTIRVASKSVRHLGLLRRIMERGGEHFRGVMCFTLEEACFLADEGHDDLLVAYPSVQKRALDEVAARVKRGKLIRLMADHPAHLAAYGRAARAHGVKLEVLIELDVAYQALRGRVHLGALRSPVRGPSDAVELARAARSIDSIEIAGIMGYEAHVAGLPDRNPFSAPLNPIRKAIKRVSIPQIAEVRRQTVLALRREGIDVRVVNGGGTGSLATTGEESCVTELTVGSGFLCSHLFDYYEGNVLEPAAFFALEVCRIPQRGVITCHGGGYIASGEPGWDRLPVPHLPRGLRYVSMEGAGEVQTPLRLPDDAPHVEIGHPIVFRHAKAGELAERFEAYLLLREKKIVAREPTYRGMGRAFL